MLDDPETFRCVLDNLQLGVYLVDRQRQILFWNQGAEAITGYLRHEVVGRFCHDNLLQHCSHQGCALCTTDCPLAQTLHEGKPRALQLYLRHKAGHRLPVHLRVVPIRNQRGGVVGAAGTFEEQEIHPEPEFRQGSLALHGCLDPVSGIPNHAFTRFRLQESIDTYKLYGLEFGILRLDIQDWPHLIETHGREAAHHMLETVAHTVQHVLSGSGFVGRWAESGVLAMIPNCSTVELVQHRQEIQQVAASSSIQWWDEHLSATIASGAAMVQNGDDIDSLVARAQDNLRAQSRSSPGLEEIPGTPGS